MICEDVKALLNPRLDEEIKPMERAEMDTHFEACPACAADFAQLENVRRAIRGGMTYHKAPSGLRDQVRFALRGAEYLDGSNVRRRGWGVWSGVAAGIALVALGSAPFLVNARNQRRQVAQELVSAHQRALMGRDVDVISSDRHTVKPWFNGKVPFSPPVVDLVGEGYPLVGGRVDYADGHAVAALVYSRRLHRIDVFVWPSAGDKSPLPTFERNGYNEIAWTKNRFEFTAVSDLNAAELAAFSRLVQERTQ